MTPSARVQASIEILDLVIEAARKNGPPADRIIADWFRSRRFAGSKDRRAVRELTFRAIRACGACPASGRAAMLRLARIDGSILPLFDGSRYGPVPVKADETAAEGGLAPAWLLERLAASGIDGEEAAALLERAPLDIRVNTIKASREGIELPETGEATASSDGLRFAPGTPVERWDAYQEGLIEVQDTGSQLACLAVDARPGETIVDLCSGAGGKTLAIAAKMENRGRLIACDTDWGRLSRLGPRSERAGVTIVETMLLDPGKEAELLAKLAGDADAVLVDAPCSGSGTWRRNPESRWRLNESQLERLTRLQARLLGIAAGLVREGGRLIYVTCSLLDEEGMEQTDAFLCRNPEWKAQLPVLSVGSHRGKGLRLTPSRDGTDGFFVAQLSRM